MWRVGKGRSDSFSPVKIVAFANPERNDELRSRNLSD